MNQHAALYTCWEAFFDDMHYLYICICICICNTGFELIMQHSSKGLQLCSPFPSSSSSFLLSAPSFPPVLTPLLPGLVLAVGARLVHILLDCLQSRQQFGNLSKKFERGDGLLENRDLLVEDWILLSELHMSLPVVVFYLDGTKISLKHCLTAVSPPCRNILHSWRRRSWRSS